MKLRKLMIAILSVSAITMSFIGCGNKDDKKDPYAKFATVTEAEFGKDVINVDSSQSSLKSVGYKFKFDTATKSYSWDEDYKQFYHKNNDGSDKLAAIAALENHETVLVNFLQKYANGFYLKKEDGALTPMILIDDLRIACESTLKLTRETIESLKVSIPKPEDSDSKNDSKGDSDLPSSPADIKKIPIPKKKPVTK